MARDNGDGTTEEEDGITEHNAKHAQPRKSTSIEAEDDEEGYLPDISEFEITNQDHLTPKILAQFIYYRLNQYKFRSQRDRVMWNNFKEDFEGWTSKEWAIACKHDTGEMVKKLRQYLRNHGVWVAIKKTSMSDALDACMQEEEPHVWTEEDLKNVELDEFNSKYNPKLQEGYVFRSGAVIVPASGTPPSRATSTPARPTTPQSGANRSATDPTAPPVVQTTAGNPNPALQSTHNPNFTNPVWGADGQPSQDVRTGSTSEQPLANGNAQQPTSTPTSLANSALSPPFNQGQNAPQYGLPSNSQPPGQFQPIGGGTSWNTPYPGQYRLNNNGFPDNSYAPNSYGWNGMPSQHNTLPAGKWSTDLSKLYTTEDKYSGEVYDILNPKLTRFYNHCRILGIPQDAFCDMFSIMLRDQARQFYFSRVADAPYAKDWKAVTDKVREHFETEERRQFYLSEWKAATYQKFIAQNPTKTKMECLELLIAELLKLQPGLNPEYHFENSLRDQVISACRGVPECDLCLMNPPPTFQEVINRLRSSVGTTMRSREAATYLQTVDLSTQKNPESYLVDRTYNTSRGHDGRRGGYGGGGMGRSYGGNQNGRKFQPKRVCYICRKLECRSWKHSLEERQKNYREWKTKVQGRVQPSEGNYQVFIVEFEGPSLEEEEETKEHSKGDDPVEQLLTELEQEWNGGASTLFTELGGELDGNEIVTYLTNQSTTHQLTRKDFCCLPEDDGRENPSTFTFDVAERRYASNTFQGIVPDSGAAYLSTAGKQQVKALLALDSSLSVNTKESEVIKFGIGSTQSQGTITVDTPLGKAKFHVVEANTPFLLCVQDLDRLGTFYNNLTDELIQGDHIVPVVRKFGHPFMLLNSNEETMAFNHLTEPELRQLHRRFGHPSVRRLLRVLQRAGHDVDTKVLEHLAKVCHYCQMHEKSPGRFKFTIKDNHEFNHTMVIDVLWIDGEAVLQVVDYATSFQAASFLKDMSAKTAWDTTRRCWIDTYLGPPEIIVHDQGTNFSSEEYRQNAKAYTIEIHEIPVEAHNSVGKVERYHTPLRRAYEIIKEEAEKNGDKLSKESMLQMAVKACNDSAGPDGLVPTLLVFGAYPRMTVNDQPTATIAQRARAIQTAMKEVRRIKAKRQVADALGMRNGPNTSPVLSLPIPSNVRVYREKVDGIRGDWTGPYKMVGITNQTCHVDLNGRVTDFRCTSVKPYYMEEEVVDEETSLEERHEDHVETVRKKPGRPKGSTAKRTIPTTLRRSARNHTTVEDDPMEDLSEQLTTALMEGDGLTMTFMTNKEKSDKQLSLKLRSEGIITTPGEPFEASTKQEMDGLRATGVYEIVQHDPEGIHKDKRVFNARLVHELKAKNTPQPFEKTRMVIQAYNDGEKGFILTQAPTIQRASQRLLLALAPALMVAFGFVMFLRDIIQAYTQSEDFLKRMILARLPKEMRHLYPESMIMWIKKALYGIPEAGTHWWATYSKHYKEKLGMVTSTFDPCLLITSGDKDEVAVAALQTDDTLCLSTEKFSQKEDEELKKANFKAKDKEFLSVTNTLDFNGCVVSLYEDGTIMIRSKGQGEKMKLIDINSPTLVDEYRSERARGQYLGTICQPEVACGLSIAAQVQEPSKDDAVTLNKILEWMMSHMDRGLRMIILDLYHCFIYVFVDASFANNKDFSSQIGFEIILGNETRSKDGDEFEMTGNMVHYSSTKTRRVTRSVLASEVYGMVAGVDNAVVIGSTIKQITEQLDLPDIPIVVCTDSYSLYECLVKLGTTKEKRLMIDIMALRQSYERRELMEIRWINGEDNPADAMTKSTPNKALQKFIDTNTLKVRMEGWVDRE